jgi:hypothetical protein
MRFQTIHTLKGIIYKIEGREVTKAEFDAACLTKPLARPPMLGGNTTTGWPMKSDGMAVHPDQVPEVMARNKKHGVYIDYDTDGCPILPDRGARRELMKIEGLIDRQGGYGDDHHIAGHEGQGEDDVKYDIT